MALTAQLVVLVVLASHLASGGLLKHLRVVAVVVLGQMLVALVALAAVVQVVVRRLLPERTAQPTLVAAAVVPMTQAQQATAVPALSSSATQSDNPF